MPTPLERFEIALHDNADGFGVRLENETVPRVIKYYEILVKWNAGLHLVAPCSPEQFATRHVLESLYLLPHLGPRARIIDLGSGGGLPIIPCLIAGNNLQATLIESSRRKAVFLREAMRYVSATATVVPERFEKVKPPAAEYVTCRAIERFNEKFSTIASWTPRGSTLLFFGGPSLRQQIESAAMTFTAFKIPMSERRFLYVIGQGP